MRWADDRKIPPMLLEALTDPRCPEDLRTDIKTAMAEIINTAIVTPETRFRIIGRVKDLEAAAELMSQASDEEAQHGTT